MIIVSQDRKSIINFDNVSFIELGEEKNKVTLGFVDLKYIFNIGEYATEERATEVLREITYIYQKQNDDFYYEDTKSTDIRFYKGYKKQHKDNVYEMPKE